MNVIMDKEATCCRVCLRKSRRTMQLSGIFCEKPFRLNYFCLFNICTRLGALHDDMLPQHLCTSCKDDLKTSFNFLQQAQQTDRKLRAMKMSSTVEVDPKTTASPQNDTLLQAAYNSVKMEFIACSKDPLEETDEEADDHHNTNHILNWYNTSISPLKDNLNDGESNKTKIDDDDDDDNKPLKELFKIEGINKHNEKIKTNKNKEQTYDDDDDYQYKMLYDGNDENFRNSLTEDVADFAISPETLIFPQGRYKCKKCLKAYFTTDGLKAHSIVHLPKADKMKKKQRGPTKKTPKSQDNTEGTVEDTEKASNEEMKIRKQKQPKPKKMFPCHVCGKHMISASKLRYHMVMHTGEKDYLCSMCPKAYSTIYALKHHMRTHTGERPYECKFCGDKFTRPTTLKSHMRRHTGERPYGCDICGKRFIQHSSMTTHMKLNHMAKTINCPHCEKKYARQTDLNTHLLSHTGNKPFSCQICPSRFIRQANLNKHMNQHHHNQQSKNLANSSASRSKASNQKTEVLTKNTLKFLATGKELGTKSPVAEDFAIPNALSTDQNMAETSQISVPSAQTTGNPTFSNASTTFSLSSTQTTCTTQANTATDNRNIVDNIMHVKDVHFSPQQAAGDPQQQTIFSHTTTTLVETEQQLGRAIDEINRWSWTSNAS